MGIGGDGPDDSGSTLVQTGKSALTFTEMAAFVHDIEARPLERLVSDMPGLLALPDAKYQLVVMVLRKKVKQAPGERDLILARLRELQSAAPDASVRQRAESFLARPSES